MTPNKALKEQAFDALQGRWGIAVGVCLIYIVVGIGAQQIGRLVGPPPVMIFAPLLISLIITGPLLVGWSGIFLRIARKQDAQVEELFDGFRNFTHNMFAYLLVSGIILLWMLPVIIPFFVILGVSIWHAPTGGLFNSGSITMLMLLLFVLLLLALLLTIPIALRYSQVFFLLADDPGLKPMEALKKSRDMMRGKKMKLFELYLSFIGWALLCVLTLFIGLLWLSPYVSTSRAKFYDDIREQPEAGLPEQTVPEVNPL